MPLFFQLGYNCHHFILGFKDFTRPNRIHLFNGFQQQRCASFRQHVEQFDLHFAVHIFYGLCQVFDIDDLQKLFNGLAVEAGDNLAQFGGWIRCGGLFFNFMKIGFQFFFFPGFKSFFVHAVTGFTKEWEQKLFKKLRMHAFQDAHYPFQDNAAFQQILARVIPGKDIKLQYHSGCMAFDPVQCQLKSLAQQKWSAFFGFFAQWQQTVIARIGSQK